MRMMKNMMNKRMGPGWRNTMGHAWSKPDFSESETEYNDENAAFKQWKKQLKMKMMKKMLKKQAEVRRRDVQ